MILGIILTILCSSIVSAELFDGLIEGEQQDNVIEIDNISFNTTNATNFTHFEKYDGAEDEIYERACYVNTEDGNQGKHTIYIIQFYDQDTAQLALTQLKEEVKDSKSIINDREVYLTYAQIGEYVGEPRYETFVYNADLNEIVQIYTPDPNETVKIASTLKFNN